MSLYRQKLILSKAYTLANNQENTCTWKPWIGKHILLLTECIKTHLYIINTNYQKFQWIWTADQCKKDNPRTFGVFKYVHFVPKIFSSYGSRGRCPKGLHCRYSTDACWPFAPPVVLNNVLRLSVICYAKWQCLSSLKRFLFLQSVWEYDNLLPCINEPEK